jgi:hypothetical protein
LKLGLVAAVSEKYGLEAYFITPNNFNDKLFCKILKPISQIDPNFFLFGDNASYHKSEYTEE